MDVEDYFQVTGFEEQMPRSGWDQMPSRVERNTLRTLDILEECGTTGTFFILGWVAQRNPELVRRISRMGHEVASHGFDHRLVYNQTQGEFREDVRKSKDLLEEITGQKVLGYRAPTFSITPKSAWAHGILAEEGYMYSSSVFPVHHDRYGWPGFGSKPQRVPAGDEKSIWEFPLPFVRIGKTFLPFGGGGYLRIYPLWLTMALIRMRIKEPDSRMVIYFHPWEIDPGQPRLTGSLLGRLRHYWGIGRMESRIRKVLGSYRFGPMAEQFLESGDSVPGRDPGVIPCAE